MNLNAVFSRNAKENIGLLTVLVSAVGVILYAASVTRFSFDFFDPVDPYWQGYNHYALALLNGRLDVPAHAIGYEGIYYQGKVYLNNYGILPAVARFPFVLFFDLENSSTARIVAFIVAITTSVVFQRIFYGLICLKEEISSSDLFWYMAVSAISWFLSASRRQHPEPVVLSLLHLPERIRPTWPIPGRGGRN